MVLLDAANPFGYGAALPLGLLREPPEALARADLVLLTRCERVEPAAEAQLVSRIAAYSAAPVLCAETRPAALWSGGERMAPDRLAGLAVDAACGIGNPQAFVHTLESLGAEVHALRRAKDHAPLSQAQLAQQGDRPVVITRQDAVKLQARPDHVWVLDIGVRLRDEAGVLDDALGRLFSSPEA